MKDVILKDDLPEEEQHMINKLKDNMLIALVKRAGGSISFTIEEIDEADAMLTLEVGDGEFRANTQERN